MAILYSNYHVRILDPIQQNLFVPKWMRDATKYKYVRAGHKSYFSNVGVITSIWEDTLDLRNALGFQFNVAEYMDNKERFVLVLSILWSDMAFMRYHVREEDVASLIADIVGT